MKTWSVLLACVASWVSSGILCAEQLKLDVAMAKPSMLSTDQATKENHVHIALTGFKLPKSKERMPANIAIVIDKSGSMSGTKIDYARQAAVQAVERLMDTDIVSVVTYDNSVNVIVPATKASDRHIIVEKINEIQASGGTALFAGVAKGASEVRKFLDPKRVNRVILLSDGKANVGPSSPAELSELGRSLIKEGISVTTVGVGLEYNEDLMSNLAMAASGNHVFIERPEYLAQVFQNELNDVISVVAQKIEVRATLAEGVRPVKVLGYPAEINGQLVAIDVGQLYAGQERYFVLEIEVPKGENGLQRPVADVSVQYSNMLTDTVDKLSSAIQVKFTDNESRVEEEISKTVFAHCVMQVANERNRVATEMRDRGDIEGAKRVLQDNASYLMKNYHFTGDVNLNLSCEANLEQADNLDGYKWNKGRKAMRARQYGEANQQRYGGEASGGGYIGGSVPGNTTIPVSDPKK